MKKPAPEKLKKFFITPGNNKEADYTKATADDFARVFLDYENTEKSETAIQRDIPLHEKFQSFSFIFIILIIIAGSFFVYLLQPFREVKPETAIPRRVLPNAITGNDYSSIYDFIGLNTEFNDQYKIPLINQHAFGLPFGCEAAAAVMLLASHGVYISPGDFIKTYLPRAQLPHRRGNLTIAQYPGDYYIGDPYTVGYGIFANGLTNGINHLLDDRGVRLTAVNVSGFTSEKLFEHIDNGRYALVWGTINFAPISWGASSWYLPNETLYLWPANQHVFILLDHTTTTVTLADPFSGRVIERSKTLFLSRWNEMGPVRSEPRQTIILMEN